MLSLSKLISNYQKVKIFKTSTLGNPQSPIKTFNLIPKNPIHHLPGQYIDINPDIKNCRKLSLSLLSYDPNLLKIAVKNSEHPTVKLLHENVPDENGNLEKFTCPLNLLKNLDEDNINEFERLDYEGYENLPSFPDLGKVDEIDIKINSDTSFVLDRETYETKNIILIAGGIGINAYMSMLEFAKNANLDTKSTITLIILVKDKNSDIFRSELKNYQNSITPNHLKIEKFIVHDNIDKVKPLLKKLDKNSKTFICGPSGMIKSFINVLERFGYEDIVVENWAMKAFDLHIKGRN